MYPLLITLCASVLTFCLLTLILAVIRRPRMEVEGRLLTLRFERGEEQEKKAVRRRRKKRKTNTTAVKTRKQLEKLENELYDVGIRMPVQRFFLLWFGVTLCLPCLLMLFGLNSLICGILAVACAVGPIIYLKLRRSKRRNQLEGQLVEAISVLVNALRAGHSFQAAMNNIAREMTGPVAEEFGRVFRETQHGMTLSESMDRMVERVGSGDLEMLCTAVLIQREVGGNLAEVLENISETIRRRLALKAEVKTRTASGRMSGYIIGALPILLLGAMMVMNPSYCAMFISTDAGHMMLAFSAVMEVIGFLVIQKIVNIKY